MEEVITFEELKKATEAIERADVLIKQSMNEMEDVKKITERLRELSQFLDTPVVVNVQGNNANSTSHCMRVISQNKHVDIPYENHAFVIEGTRILTKVGFTYATMGCYETPEDASDALMKLHEAYFNFEKVFKF